ncbi:hypothetical protein [Streptomyces sp. NBC_01353]|uniref:hypothetical protein n=1 Tax=Streptomyces sp. NBC_01353 TaxID=2903835 RepID=UPI002E3523B2|nr:hypothetical protein [Streptomyces sp. NBC_01353]
MDKELTEGVKALAAAGYGPDSGLHLHEHAYGVLITWYADPLVRLTIDAHAADPLHMPGLRAALATALTSVLREAGLKAVPQPDGFILATRHA